MSGAAGGAGVWAEASAWVAALGRATCWRKVRRLVDIRYRVLSGGDGWGGQGVGTPIWRKLAILNYRIGRINRIGPVTFGCPGTANRRRLRRSVPICPAHIIWARTPLAGVYKIR